MPLLKLKVCGMKEEANIGLIASLNPDFMGFIFYQGSKRYVNGLRPLVTKRMPQGITKVGVFVNESAEEIGRLAYSFGFDHLQLHGSETPEECFKLQAQGFKIIKAFQIVENFNFKVLQPYQPHCKYFLFDTPTPHHGGSGQMFDWSLLQRYDLELPFFLSGGIDESSLQAIYDLNHPQLYAVDINSKFEIVPGIKDFNRVERFKVLLSQNIQD